MLGRSVAGIASDGSASHWTKTAACWPLAGCNPYCSRMWGLGNNGSRNAIQNMDPKNSARGSRSSGGPAWYLSLPIAIAPLGWVSWLQLRPPLRAARPPLELQCVLSGEPRDPRHSHAQGIGLLPSPYPARSRTTAVRHYAVYWLRPSGRTQRRVSRISSYGARCVPHAIHRTAGIVLATVLPYALPPIRHPPPP